MSVTMDIMSVKEYAKEHLESMYYVGAHRYYVSEHRYYVGERAC